MKRKGRLKKMVLYILTSILLIIVGALLFMLLYPSFGGNPSKEQKETYNQLENYTNGKFVNEVTSKSDFDSWKTLFEGTTDGAAGKEKKPSSPQPVAEIDWNKVNNDEDSITWLGHSTYLLSMDNRKMLVDPMLESVASPVSFVGSKRYPYSTDIYSTIVSEMPTIDAVLITHDHYDHLDYTTVVELKDKVSRFIVPLGVSGHLVRWGVPASQITELNWWDEMEFEGITLALGPARHFSGRSLFNMNSTLWGSWVISGTENRLFISGDGGYGAHFEEIGRKYGPFDLAIIEGGQYDKKWSDIHMIPEQSIQASLDVNTTKMMLSHWGAFTLASHDWRDPIQRAIKAAKEKDVDIVVPQIGETLSISALKPALPSWWDGNSEIEG
ncbi:MBL fold metallo-hydrolase [Paenibacillus tundrae]